jgi:prophage regulatory protein
VQASKSSPPDIGDPLLDRKQVEVMTTKSKSAIYKGIRLGEFPAPFNCGGRRVAWKRSTVQAWLDGLQQKSV